MVTHSEGNEQETWVKIKFGKFRNLQFGLCFGITTFSLDVLRPTDPPKQE